MFRKLLLAGAAFGALAVPAFAQTTPAAPATATPPAAMDKGFNADTDGDGMLSRAEFDAMQTKHFEAMDANKDGKISKDELKNSREKMRGMRDQWMEKHKEMKAK